MNSDDGTLFFRMLAEDPPPVHRGETEMARTPDRAESYLDDATWAAIPWQGSSCYGISPDLAAFLYHSVAPGWTTLETGSGLSTLLFAHKGATHVAVTPNAAEATVLRTWAAQHGVSLGRTTFALQASEDYLPQHRGALDCLLVDGKHAFPWPTIDFFFGARHLKPGGLLILDDSDLASVAMVADVLREDAPRWQLVQEFGRSICFRKLTDSLEDVSWHMQPYVANRFQRQAPRGLPRIIAGIKRRLRDL